MVSAPFIVVAALAIGARSRTWASLREHVTARYSAQTVHRTYTHRRGPANTFLESANTRPEHASSGIPKVPYQAATITHAATSYLICVASISGDLIASPAVAVLRYGSRAWQCDARRDHAAPRTAGVVASAPESRAGGWDVAAGSRAAWSTAHRRGEVAALRDRAAP